MLGTQCPNPANHHLDTRILALDLHPRSFGYVVVQRGKLFDWGVRRSPEKVKSRQEALSERLRYLFLFWKPDVVIIRIGQHKSKDIRELFRRMRKEISGVPVLPVLFPRGRALGRSRYESAADMKVHFPGFGWKLPPKRKPWESDHYWLSIFEALHIAATYIS